jgi:hypothetical protein
MLAVTSPEVVGALVKGSFQGVVRGAGVPISLRSDEQECPPLDHHQLANSISTGKNLDKQGRLMFRKRKVFMYEDEVRVQLIKEKVKEGKRSIEYPMDLALVAPDITFDPWFDDEHFKFLKRHLLAEFGIRPAKATLHRESSSHPLLLA